MKDKQALAIVSPAWWNDVLYQVGVLKSFTFIVVLNHIFVQISRR